jgi:hypothetical protein
MRWAGLEQTRGSGMRTKVWKDHLENLLKLILGNKAVGVNTIHMAKSRDQSP